ncbi:MAG: hypothetical protein KGH66_03755, partial [Candidatus Micrarchaeota archaeon]|nr:hypothetical protein [Candidatus Micrarchaeota archaeon]
NSNSNSNSNTNSAGICLPAGCVASSASCINALDIPGVACQATAAPVGSTCPSSSPDICSATQSSTLGTGSNSQQSGISSAAITQIQKEIGNICNSIEGIVFILGLALMLLGGALYAGAHVMPSQTRGQIQGYGMSMLMGGVVGVIIALLAPWMLNEVISLSNSGVPKVSCSSTGAVLTNTGLPTSPTSPSGTTPSTSGGNQQASGNPTISVTPGFSQINTGAQVQYSVTVTDPNPSPYTVTVSDAEDPSVHDSFQMSGTTYTYAFTLPSSAPGGINTLNFGLSDTLSGSATTTATIAATAT